jgi:hypothetical protein
LIERAVSVANSNVSVDSSIDLHELYSDRNLLDYATRTDVADMLYYILTGDTKDEDEDGDEDEIMTLNPLNMLLKRTPGLRLMKKTLLMHLKKKPTAIKIWIM